MILSSDQKSLLITIKKPVEKKFDWMAEESEDEVASDEEDFGDVEAVVFKEANSKSSCKLSEIKGFVYGGISSRFWMFRKHINFLEEKVLKNLPFYAWQCISLQLESRTVDLVIKDELQMNIFIKFLLFTLNTVDGKRDTARPYINYVMDK